jgi:hypothetical protein
MMTEKTYQRIFLAFFALLAFALISPINYATAGLDQSWTQAILLLTQQGKTFGQDLIFTYGPLGYLSFKLPPEHASVIPILLIDGIAIGHFVFLLTLAFERFPGKKWIYPAIIGLIILLPWGVFADLSFTYFYFFIFWMLFAYYRGKTNGTWAALLIVILLFFIKVNISLIVYSLFVFNSIILGLTRKITWKLVGLQNLALIAGIFLSSIYLHVNLFNYLAYTIPLIDGYQDSMATIIISTSGLIGLLFVEFLIIGVFFWQIFVLKTSFKHNFYLYFLLAIILFLGFKQAHTAISNPNLFGFFLLIPMVNGLLFLFSDRKYTARISGGFVLVLAINLLATQYIRYADGNYSAQGYLSTFRPVNINPIHYFEKLFGYQYAKNFDEKPLQLPEKIKTKIGQQTVDILHNDVSYIFFNKLNYNPRPIIQTYSAFSPELMKVNGEKYAGQTAPEFVFFKLDQFREQNPFWADTDVNFELLNRYAVHEQFTVGQDTLLLLQKTQSLHVNQRYVFSLPHIKQDQYIPIPQKNEPYRMIANLEYSIWGKICRFIFQPPYMYCTVYYSDGTQKEYRVIDKILKGGVIVNKRVVTQQELATFYTHKGEKNTNVKGIKFHTRFPWAYL